MGTGRGAGGLDKTERETEVGRRTRDEMVKWNKMPVLKSQTVGRQQISPAFLRGPGKETGLSVYSFA